MHLPHGRDDTPGKDKDEIWLNIPLWLYSVELRIILRRIYVISISIPTSQNHIFCNRIAIKNYKIGFFNGM